jgi:hypothetical protein
MDKSVRYEDTTQCDKKLISIMNLASTSPAIVVVNVICENLQDSML